MTDADLQAKARELGYMAPRIDAYEREQRILSALRSAREAGIREAAEAGVGLEAPSQIGAAILALLGPSEEISKQTKDAIRGAQIAPDEIG